MAYMPAYPISVSVVCDRQVLLYIVVEAILHGIDTCSTALACSAYPINVSVVCDRQVLLYIVVEAILHGIGTCGTTVRF